MRVRLDQHSTLDRNYIMVTTCLDLFECLFQQPLDLGANQLPEGYEASWVFED